MLPMKGSGLSVTGISNQSPVGNRRKSLRNRDDHFGGGPLLRGIMAGEPVAVVFVLPLRPGLLGFVRILAIGPDKMKPQFRLRDLIIDRHFNGGSPGNRFGPVNLDLSAGVLKFESAFPWLTSPSAL